MAASPLPQSGPTPAPELAPLSEGARILNTFVAPSKTFTDLRRNASWWAPWLLIAAFSLLFVYAMDRQIGFDQISKTAIERSSRADQFDKLPADQQNRQIRITTNFTRYVSYGSPVIALIIFLLIATVMWLTFKLAANATVPFKVAMATIVYGSLPGIVGGALGAISLFAGVNPEGFDPNNPVATNPAYFMDFAGSKFVRGMASSLDVISIWSIVLIGIGFACNSKVKRSTAIVIVAAWFLVYKLAGASLAAAFS
jgi:hypothetical protein